MSAEAVCYVLENSKAKPIPRLVLVSIANHARADGSNSCVSLSVIGRETGVSHHHIRKCLRILESMGELSTAVNASSTGGNVYEIAGMVGGLRGIPLPRSPLPRSYVKERERRTVEKWPVVRPMRARKAAELWSELHVGTLPRAQGGQ